MHFPDTGVIIPCSVPLPIQKDARELAYFQNNREITGQVSTPNSRSSLYFSLLAGNICTGDRFAADSIHRHFVAFWHPLLQLPFDAKPLFSNVIFGRRIGSRAGRDV